MDSPILFSERQQFNKLLMWFLFLLAVTSLIFGFRKEITPGMTLQELFTAHLGLVITFIGVVLACSLIFVFRLETVITREAIQVRFFPFHIKMRIYKWTDIAEVSVRHYRPLLEYGGWGIRGFGKNRAFNTSGNLGIQLVFQNGDRLLIGTNKADEVRQVLSEL